METGLILTFYCVWLTGYDGRLQARPLGLLKVSTGKKALILLPAFLAGIIMLSPVFAQEAGGNTAIPGYLHDGGLQDELSLAAPDGADPDEDAATGDFSNPMVQQLSSAPAALTTIPGREEKSRQVIIYTTAVILVIVLAVLAVLLIRRFRYYRTAGKEVAAESACLIDLDGVTSRRSYILGTKPVMLGRVAGRDSDHLDYIVIPQTTIGRRHALIEYKDYAYWVIDQGSINGTFVNGIPVGSEVRLKHGDRVRLHKIEFEFVLPDLDGSSMTEISKTVLAGQAAVIPDDVPETDRDKVHGSGGFELELDLYAGEDDRNRGSSHPADDDATLMPHEVPLADDSPGEDPDDVTLMPDEVPLADDSTDNSSDDETLLPGQDGENDKEKP